MSAPRLSPPHLRRAIMATGMAMLLAAGCSEQSDSNSSVLPAELIDAWKQAGLTPTVFMPAELEALRPGVCKQGKIDAVETIFCSYTDAAAARAAQPAGLAQVGEATGLALTAGPRLLIVADRDNIDPAGRTINTITTAFRKHETAPAAGDGGKAAAPGKSQAPGKNKAPGKDKGS